MNDARRASLPASDERGRVVRLLLIALGVLGFVVLPGAAPASGSSGIGVRAGAAQPGQPGPANRGKSQKPAPAPRADCAIASAAVRQLAPTPDQVPALVTPDAGVRPPSGRLVPYAVRPQESFDAAPAGLPQGRAPPSLHLI